MISAEAAGLAIQVAKGVIKLSQRLDTILAEKAAVQEGFSVPAPNVSLRPNKTDMKKGLQALLAETPSPLTTPQRNSVKRALDSNAVDKLHSAVIRYLPRLAMSRSFDPDSEFVAALKVADPAWAEDSDRVVALFHIGAGDDTRNLSYAWRIGLTVVDVLAEFGAENASLFTRDEKVQGLVSSILRRLGESDLQKHDSTKDVLRAAIAATLNGALDARESLQVENEWLDAVLDAFVAARGSVGDNLLVGLMSGEGYPALVGALLETAAARIDDDEATNFKDVAADFLKQIGSLVGQQQSFEDFFEDHWGDLLRAGLKSAEKYGPQLLGDKKLLGKVLKRVAGDLAAHDDSKLLSTDSLFGIVNSTAAVVAENPNLVNKLLGTNQDWIGTLIRSVADTVADSGIQKVFSKEGVEELFQDAFATFAKHPDLLVGDNELAGKLVGGVLEELSGIETFAVKDIATSAVGGALEALSENPDLLDMEYAEVVASLAGKVASLVENNTITGIRAADLMGVMTATLAENPELFLTLERKLAEGVVDAVLKATEDRPVGLVAGSMVVNLLSQVTSVLARRGKAARKNHPLEELMTQLEAVVGAGLTRAERELGNTLSMSSLPTVIGMLVEAWTQGKVLVQDPENDNFKALFSELTKLAVAA